MKTISYNKIGKLANTRAKLFAAAVLLLLLSMVEIFHLSEHHIIGNDQQCFVCHASKSFEDTKVSDTQLLTIEYQVITLVESPLELISTFIVEHLDNIRAPPVL